MPTNNVQTIDAHINMNGHRIGDLGAPTSENEAATKGYVDAQILKFPNEDQKDGATIWSDSGVLKISSAAPVVKK